MGYKRSQIGHASAPYDKTQLLKTLGTLLITWHVKGHTNSGAGPSEPRIPRTHALGACLQDLKASTVGQTPIVIFIA
eukprot:847074-Amphidinium_carterae.1